MLRQLWFPPKLYPVCNIKAFDLSVPLLATNISLQELDEAQDKCSCRGSEQGEQTILGEGFTCCDLPVGEL